MELQLAYCDDEALVGQIFIPKIQAEFQRQGVRAHVSLVSSPKRLLSLVESGKTFDAYFLDIDMPQLDGITLGRHLRERAPNAAIIFLSNKEEMVYSAFRVKPLRFLRKNRFEAEIADAVQAVLLSLREVERKTVIFEDGNQVYRFSPREPDADRCARKGQHSPPRNHYHGGGAARAVRLHPDPQKLSCQLPRHIHDREKGCASGGRQSLADQQASLSGGFAAIYAAAQEGRRGGGGLDYV